MLILRWHRLIEPCTTSPLLAKQLILNPSRSSSTWVGKLPQFIRNSMKPSHGRSFSIQSINSQTPSVKPKILGWMYIVSVNDVRSPSNHRVETDAAHRASHPKR